MKKDNITKKNDRTNTKKNTTNTVQKKNGSKIIKTISLICIAILVANIFLFAFRVYSAAVMWIVIVIIALIAFPGMKILRGKLR